MKWILNTFFDTDINWFSIQNEKQCRLYFSSISPSITILNKIDCPNLFRDNPNNGTKSNIRTLDRNDKQRTQHQKDNGTLSQERSYQHPSSVVHVQINDVEGDSFFNIFIGQHNFNARTNLTRSYQSAPSIETAKTAAQSKHSKTEIALQWIKARCDRWQRTWPSKNFLHDLIFKAGELQKIITLSYNNWIKWKVRITLKISIQTHNKLCWFLLRQLLIFLVTPLLRKISVDSPKRIISSQNQWKILLISFHWSAPMIYFVSAEITYKRKHKDSRKENKTKCFGNKTSNFVQSERELHSYKPLKNS